MAVLMAEIYLSPPSSVAGSSQNFGFLAQNVIAEQTTEEMVTDIQAEGATQKSAVTATGAATIQQVQQAISDSQAAINTLETQKDNIVQSVASMAQLGTDTSLSTAGMAADAKAAGDAISSLSGAILSDNFIEIEKSNTHGYFAQPTTVNVLEPTSYSTSYTSPIVWDKCNRGDIYKATITGLSGLYPYVICDNSGNVIEHGITSRGVTDKIIVIPDGGSYFGANQYGANDYVSKKAGIPKENAFKINKLTQKVNFLFNHAYIGTSSPVDITNPATTSASYNGGYIFEECNAGDIYVINSDATASAAYNVFICDSTGAIISHTLIGRAGKNLKNWYVEIPTNGRYIGINCGTDGVVYKYIEITLDMFPKESENVNPFEGLNGVAFGTSLTQRADGSGTYGYLTTLRENLGCTIENQGVGGSYWFLTDYSNRSVTYVVENYANYADKDFVIIEGCVNDWFTSKVLGTYTDNVYTSVCGCLRKMIEHVYSQNPTAQIFVILDHQGRENNGNDCSATAIVNGKTQYEYYSELKKVCQLYSVPVICEFEDSNIGMFGTQYLADNIHCNALGAKQSGTYIGKKMREIGLKAK